MNDTLFVGGGQSTRIGATAMSEYFCFLKGIARSSGGLSDVRRTSAGPTRWTMPSLWPQKHPLITFLALDSNMPFADSKSPGRTFTLKGAINANHSTHDISL